ncbi:MAG: magnesium/cobalt transporter CorA [Syntrophaceae bacterium]|nr:magnesium/cobalt transporter CorA [Syntrophaceae bacterium]
MTKRIRKQSKKAGLPPGTLIHIGEKLSDEIKISLMSYDDGHIAERSISTLQECRLPADFPGVTWINVEGLHDVKILEQVGANFGMHPLILEDILNTGQRPKIEDLGNYIFIVLKMFSNQEESGEELEAEQVSIILGSNYVISFWEKEGKTLDPIKERIRNGKGRIRKMGASYLTYGILDAIVDSYFIVLERLGEKIETYEDSLVNRPTSHTLQAIQHLKREMIFLRKSVWPLREIIGYLERTESSLIDNSVSIFFKDVYDHTIQLIDTIETFRDTLSSMLDIYLSSISNKMNEVMKVLTIIATLFMPLTFMAGVYGMNFQNFPELKWQYGYLMFWIVIAVMAILMIIYFKRKKWM